MSDFERFENYWQETIDAIYYRMRNTDGIMLTREAAGKLWREEINKRFFSRDIIHGATTFLDDLKQRCPELGAKVESALLDVPELGSGKEDFIKSGATVAAGAVGLLSSVANIGIPKTIRVVEAFAGVGFAMVGVAKTAKQVNNNSPYNLAKEINRISNERLIQFAALFGEKKGG